jgi:competence protein ComEA
MKKKVLFVFSLWLLWGGVIIFSWASSVVSDSLTVTSHSSTPASLPTNSSISDSPSIKTSVAASTSNDKDCIDVNTANWVELDKLPGVGESIAKKIIEYRNAHGPFSTIDDLDQVKGIGPAKLEKMKDRICL